MASKPRGIDSPTEDGFATHVTENPSHATGKGGDPAYPRQTPSNALGGPTIERHFNRGDGKPGSTRKGSKGNVDRSVTSDALVKTQ